jgi:phage/plasmid-like protein (TIGR03299 family)
MTSYFTDGAFFNGEAAWHGGGNVVDGWPASTREALQLGNLLWTPRLETLTTASGLTAPGRAVVRPDNGTVLGVVSDTFRIHSHVDMFSRLMDGLDGAVHISAVTGLHDGSIVTISAEIIGGSFDVSSGDTIRKYVNAWTGHTGKLSTCIQVGGKTRVVCQNTLTAAQSDETDFTGKVKHSQHSLIALDQLLSQVHAMRDDDTSAQLYREMHNHAIGDLGFSQYVASVFQVAEPKKLPAWEKLEALWQGEAIGSAMAGATVWGAYNVITEFSTHHSGRTKDTQKAAAIRALSNAFGSGASLIERAEEQARMLTLA